MLGPWHVCLKRSEGPYLDETFVFWDRIRRGHVSVMAEGMQNIPGLVASISRLKGSWLAGVVRDPGQLVQQVGVDSCGPAVRLALCHFLG